MSYESLREKYGKIVRLEEINNKGSVIVDITNFTIKEMKGKEVEFIQYVLFIYFKAKECNIKNRCYTEMNIYLKDVGIKNFSPKFLKRVVGPFNKFIKEGKELSIKPKKINDDTKRLWGMNRSLLNNAIIGASSGYSKTLELFMLY